MRDFPSCFGEGGIQIVDSSSGSARNSQNSVTCIYQSSLCGDSCSIAITWSKNLMGQGLSIGIEDSFSRCLCRFDIKPWLFSKRKGSKSVDAGGSRLDIFWDLAMAKFGSGPEPLEDFYLAVVAGREMVLLLGDLCKEAYRKTNATPPSSSPKFLSKKEHISGKKMYCSKAQFWGEGQVHDVLIECETAGLKDPCLIIHIDRKILVQVKHLKWKFRGNQTILVDGLPVDVFWDVYNWLFSSTAGNAVFMFRSGGVVSAAEKLWCSGGDLSDPCLLPWSYSQIFRETQQQVQGFSLVLFAWKTE